MRRGGRPGTIKFETVSQRRRQMSLFMHTGPAIEEPPTTTAGVRCLKSWVDRDAQVRHTLVQAPDRIIVERSWPDADVAELFAPVERWLSVAESRTRARPFAT